MINQQDNDNKQQDNDNKQQDNDNIQSDYNIYVIEEATYNHMNIANNATFNQIYNCDYFQILIHTTYKSIIIILKCYFLLFVEASTKMTDVLKRTIQQTKSTLESLINIMFIFYYLKLLPHSSDDRYLRNIFLVFYNLYQQLLIELEKKKEKAYDYLTPFRNLRVALFPPSIIGGFIYSYYSVQLFKYTNLNLDQYIINNEEERKKLLQQEEEEGEEYENIETAIVDDIIEEEEEQEEFKKKKI